MAIAETPFRIMEEIADLFASGPSRDDLLAFRPSSAAGQRATELLDRQADGEATSDDQRELDQTIAAASRRPTRLPHDLDGSAMARYNDRVVVVAEIGQRRGMGANMRTDLTGTVIAGALKLDAPVALPDQSRVRVTVESVDDSNEGWKKAIDALKRLRQERPIHAGDLRYSRDELHERN